MIFILLVFCSTWSQETHTQTWESYYLECSSKDEFFQQAQFRLPEPVDRQKSWSELSRKSRRAAKTHIRTFYGVRPSSQGYLVEAFQTSGKSIARVAVYIVTMSAAAIVVGVLLNQRP